MTIDTNDRLAQILSIDKELERIKDIDLLLECLLLQARREANADAGTVYMYIGEALAFSHTQNDTLQRRLKPHEKLPYTYFTVPVNDESISGFVAKHKIFLNIPDMYNIDESCPYSFNPAFDNIADYKTVSSLTFPLIAGEDELLGVMQLINAKDKKGHFVPFKESDIPFFEVFARFASKAIQRAQMTRNLLETISRIAGLRDPIETGSHVNRVGAYSMEIYEAWSYRNKITEDERQKMKDNLRMAAMLHDVGKVGISDLILKKPGKLTDEEYRNIQSHTWIGAQQFTDKSELSRHAYEVTLRHHENWDGSGYPGNIGNIFEANKYINKKLPDGLAGKEIPLFARIVSISDVFDALSSNRSYKRAWAEKEILREIEKESERKFDPELVDVFFSIFSTIKSIRKRYSGETS
ncbi:MAG: hypothetical protein B0D92_05060 [Spirochaeta sp. LUC14_002_19_P3]|nr:MAG: hypothetical protein B0D92_05060 [Spirochaeta sp. LUC14_002_19_P3]